MSTRLSVLMLIAIALLAAGCGENKKGSPSSNAAASTTMTTTSTPSQAGSTGAESGKPLSASRLIAKADTICARMNTELHKDVIQSRADIVRAVPRRVAIEQAGLRELSRLTPPTSMAPDYQQMLADRRTLIEDTTKAGEAVTANNKQAEVSMLASGATLERQMAKTAERDGFKHCGQLS